MGKSKNEQVISKKKKKHSSQPMKEEEEFKHARRDRDIFSVHVRKRTSKKNAAKNASKDELFSDDEDEAVKELQQFSAQTKAHKNKFLEIVKQSLKISNEEMHIGTVVAACVTRVFTDRIYVSLPHKMKGYIPLTHISAQYTNLMHQLAEGQPTGEVAHTLPELFRPGQFLTASVTAPPDDSMTPLKRLQKLGLPLSLYPSDVHGSNVSASMLRSGCVLQCSIISCEDHGFTIDTGVRGVSAAFLPEKNVPQGELIAVGSVLQCCIVSITGEEPALSMTLTALPDAVRTASKKTTTDKYDLMMPGCHVSCVVSQSTADGIAVHLGTEEDYYSSLSPEDGEMGTPSISPRNVGIISSQHLRGPFDQSHVFRVGQKLVATVLLITTMPRTVHLTLNKALFNNCVPEEEREDPQHGLAVASVIRDATVMSTAALGMFVRLSNKCKGFCPIGKLPLSVKPNQIAKKYQAGLQVSCKLMHFNPFDQCFLVSMRKDDIAEIQEVSELLKVGQVVPVTVMRYVESGAVVKYKPRDKGGKHLAPVEGFVPKLHLSDASKGTQKLQHPLGATVKARVFAIRKDDPTRKDELLMTLKSCLVQSKCEIVEEYSEDNFGKEVEGVITKALPDKVFVQFFGDTFGILFTSDFSLVPNFTETFTVGSVVKVKIRGMNKQDPPMYFLTLSSDIVNPLKRKLGADFDPAVERLKIIKKNRKESWLKNLKSSVTASTK